METKNKMRTKYLTKMLAIFVIGLLLNGSSVFISAQKGDAKSDKQIRKRALLIGISKYQRDGKLGEWANLNTDLDVKLLREVLMDKFKFAESDIVVLQDEKATKANILKEWRKIVAETQKGDIVFVHFSGHGASIDDDNGDEIDGKDESLIPYDYATKKDDSKNIRDDEIGVILDELKKKQPGNVTVTIDSCFSGTATRGDYAVRGGGDEEDVVKPETESPSGLEDKGADYPKEYVFLAASSPRQTAKETDYDKEGRIGVFSYALIKALNNATPNTTYRDLFERVNDVVTTIRRDQNPQLEGSLDEIVFDGTAVRQERFITVKPLASGKTESKAILQTGALQGATVKSHYALFEAGTKDPKDKSAVKIAEGEIVETDAITSVLKLDKPIESEKLKTARAFETVHYYQDSPLKVVLQDVGKVKGGDAVTKEFIKNNARGDSASGEEEFGLAEFTEAAATENLRGEFYDVKIYPAGEKEINDKIVAPDFHGLVMQRKDGSILETISENKKLSSEIKAALERENRYLTIKGLKDNEDSRLKINLRVVPVNVELDSAGRVKKAIPKGDVPRNTGGQPQLNVGDYIMLEVENVGDIGAYVTILNLRADGKIGPGFPQNVEGTPDNYIKAEQKLLIPVPYVFQITKPLGEESFRAIATIEPTDFTPLIDEDLLRRGDPPSDRSKTAAQSPLGKILSSAQKGKRTGIVASVPPSWATSSFTYQVNGQ